MDFLLFMFAVTVVLCTWSGVKLIARGLRESKAPPIPVARATNLEGMDAVYAKAHRVATRAPRKIANGVAVSIGFGLIAAPWLLVFRLFNVFDS